MATSEAFTRQHAIRHDASAAEAIRDELRVVRILETGAGQSEEIPPSTDRHDLGHTIGIVASAGRGVQAHREEDGRDPKEARTFSIYNHSKYSLYANIYWSDVC